MLNTNIELDDFYSKHRLLCLEFDALSMSDPKFEDKRDVVWKKSDELFREAAQSCTPMSPVHMEWFKKELSGKQDFWKQEKNYFALAVLGTFVQVNGHIPNDLALYAFDLAINEPDPSYNKLFLEPAVCGLGGYEICRRLLEMMHNGSNYEKTSALNALYWAASKCFDREAWYFFKEVGDKNSPDLGKMRKQILTEATHICLVEFVNNEDLDLRRSFVRWISSDERVYPEALRPLVEKALRIALQHPDEFIRQHMQRQIIPDGLIAPLPPRQKQESV